jgi:hypothetical protein
MNFTQKLAVVVLGVLVLSAVAFVGVASAQQYPTVSNLTPFTAETNFMSLAGYLRYLNHQTTGQWLTFAEATRIVGQQ